MQNSITQNPIRVNHVGFTEKGNKRFVLTDNKTGEDTFRVYHFYECDKAPREVYRGKMVLEDEQRGLWTGDFSDVTQEGDYYIEAGGHTSRYFLIYDKAYEHVSRILLSYFTYQRCGSDLGWAGKCHTDDGIIKETGEHVDLAGGYHQSGDLRKSPAGVSIGVLGMMRYAMKDQSAWGKTLLTDEVQWACDYYTKNIQENGAMYNTLSAPFGWGPRVFYKSAAPSSAQWCTTSILALGAIFFQEKNEALSHKYLEAAVRSWQYMTGEERSSEVYQHPDVTPRGMEADNTYYMCQKGNTADMAYMAVVAADLYAATGDVKYLDYVRKGADKLISLMGEGNAAMCVLLNDDDEHLAFMCTAYAHANGGFMALCSAAELLGEEKYFNAIRSVAKAICRVAKTNPWYITRPVYSDKDLDMVFGHPAPGRYLPSIREKLSDIQPVGTVAKNGKEVNCFFDAKLGDRNFAPTENASKGAFLMRASKLLGDKEFASVAQSQADVILGANLHDASLVNSVGHNHLGHKPYGQFFPPVPYIPGAINVVLTGLSHEECSEYDMPCVGMFMYLLSECLE
ncbi:MAG: glycoside hydrolase family 9 protein [Lachnospiraceae bacterium]|nr:glycoside hydrolase family 9 protein [Lachnospiraceae bacterium]